MINLKLISSLFKSFYVFSFVDVTHNDCLKLLMVMCLNVFLSRLLHAYEEIKEKFVNCLADIFFPHTVDEWINVHITAKTLKLKEFQ